MSQFHSFVKFIAYPTGFLISIFLLFLIPLILAIIHGIIDLAAPNIYVSITIGVIIVLWYARWNAVGTKKLELLGGAKKSYKKGFWQCSTVLARIMFIISFILFVISLLLVGIGNLPR